MYRPKRSQTLIANYYATIRGKFAMAFDHHTVNIATRECEGDPGLGGPLTTDTGYNAALVFLPRTLS